jgi:hypothetical protein
MVFSKLLQTEIPILVAGEKKTGLGNILHTGKNGVANSQPYGKEATYSIHMCQN